MYLGGRGRVWETFDMSLFQMGEGLSQTDNSVRYAILHYGCGRY